MVLPVLVLFEISKKCSQQPVHIQVQIVKNKQTDHLHFYGRKINKLKSIYVGIARMLIVKTYF